MIIGEKDYVQCLEVEHIKGENGNRDIWRGLHYYEDYYIEDGVRHPFSDAPEYIQERKRRWDEQERQRYEASERERKRELRTTLIAMSLVFVAIMGPTIYGLLTDQYLAPFIIIGLGCMVIGTVFGIGKGLPGD